MRPCATRFWCWWASSCWWSSVFAPFNRCLSTPFPTSRPIRSASIPSHPVSPPRMSRNSSPPLSKPRWQAWRASSTSARFLSLVSPTSAFISKTMSTFTLPGDSSAKNSWKRRSVFPKVTENPNSAPTARDWGKSSGTRSNQPTRNSRPWICARYRTGTCA